MKIISWNCNMAFRKKYTSMLDLNPDLLVLQECENEKKLKEALKDTDYNQIIWHGKNPHKGVAVISFNSVNIELDPDHNLEFEYIVPFKVKSKRKVAHLFCIWAMPHETERSKDYVGQIWGAVNYYSKTFNKKALLIGDFNSNTFWDKKNRVGNHTDVVKFLNDKKIYSLYHQQYELKHGSEEHPTLFLLKKRAKPYHIDYCFVSQKLIDKNTKIEVGEYEDWIKLSDHMPLIIENLKF